MRGICVIDVQPTHLQQLRDVIISIWTKTSEECFQQAVLKANEGPTSDKQVAGKCKFIDITK